MHKGFIYFLLHVVAITLSTNSFATAIDYPVNPQESKTHTQSPVEKSKDKTALSESSGEAIYRKTCIACHGTNGKGIAPSYPDFTRKGGVLSQPFSVLFKNIKQGIGSMPAKGGYPALTDEDLKATLNYIETTFAPESTPEQNVSQAQEMQLMKLQINDLTQKVATLEGTQSKGQVEQLPLNSSTTKKNLTKNEDQVKSKGIASQSAVSKENTTTSNSSGKAIYQKTCVACHGTNGKGIAPSFPDFTKKGGVLSQPSGVLLNNIKQGIGSMPAKGGDPALTDQDLKAALDYIENTFASEHKSASTQETPSNTQQPNNLTQKPTTVESTTKNPTNNTGQVNAESTSYFWPNPDISSLLTGAASAGYSVPRNASGSFNILDFNPLFLFRYKDLLFTQASVDFALDDDGNTNVGLNTVNLNLLINDFMVFGIGEFDNPLGYFVQNLSPSWINKLPTSPVGFNSDEAAPQSQLGAQLRGGFYFLSSLKMNYITFVANGPRAFADTNTGLIDFITTDSFPNNYGNFIGGGRIGFLPIHDLEIGLSGAGGKLALFDVNTNMTLGEIGRNYTSLGLDLSFKWKGWDLRGEVIRQQIGSEVTSMFPQGESWKAWYVQAGYLIPATKLEPIVRWGGYTSPVSSQSQHQVALGVDYWFAPSIAVQAAYEINKGQPYTDSDVNLFLIQLVFGF